MRQLPDQKMAPMMDRALVYGGWLDGPRTYLWFGWENGVCLGTLDGKQLLSLARRIVSAMQEQS